MGSKRQFFLFILLHFLTVLRVFPGDGFFRQTYGSVLNGETVYIIENENLKIYIPGGNNYYYETITESDLDIGGDGYVRVSLFGRRPILLYGGNFVVLIERGGPNYSSYNPDIPTAPLIESGALEVLPFDIKGVKGTSVYEEVVRGKRVVYGTGDLNRIFCGGWLSFCWNEDVLPWVEGKAGDGIGEKLFVEFTRPKNHILILNGFVDFARLNLYKDNNRLKKAVIRSIDDGIPFEVETSFEDVVKLHKVDFPREALKVEIEIAEVYPGLKWEDTAITGLATNQSWNDYSYMKKSSAKAVPYSEGAR